MRQFKNILTYLQKGLRIANKSYHVSKTYNIEIYKSVNYKILRIYDIQSKVFTKYDIIEINFEFCFVSQLYRK